MSQDAVFTLHQQYLVLFLLQPRFMGLEIKGGNGCAILGLDQHNFKLCWFKGLSWKERNVSEKEHNSDSIDLEAEIVMCPLGLLASESTSRQGGF